LEDSSIEGAQGVLINISGGMDIGLHEVEQAASIITERVNADAKVIFGTALGITDSDEVSVTVVATGFQKENVYDSAEDGPLVKKTLPSDLEKRNGLRKVPRLLGKEIYGAGSEEIWDVPTFLRRQAD
jgi:cell division protein FtsZ